VVGGSLPSTPQGFRQHLERSLGWGDVVVAKIADKPRTASGSPADPARRAGALLPGWVPLAVAMLGFGLVLSPEGIPWWARVVGAALLGAGAFWLGQDRQHDPHDRVRIMQLERALLTMGVLRRAGDDEAPRGSGGLRPSPPSKEHGMDEPLHLDTRPGAATGPQRDPDLDDPLPGEER